MSEKKKVIEKHKLKVSNQNYTRLSYEMVFHDRNHTKRSLTDEDLTRALNENNKEWEARLQKEIKAKSEENYKNGYADGIKDSSDVIVEHLKPVQKAFNELNEQFSDFMVDLKPHITALVFELTEKVLGIPMADDALKDKIQRDINTILEELDDGIKAKIYLSADDYDAFGDLIGAGEKQNSVTIAVDKNMNPGEYKVETAHELVLHNFKQILQDLKESTTIESAVKADVDAVVYQ